MPLAKSMAGKFSNLDYNEALGEALLGLVLAASTFDPERGFQFAALARRIIYNRLCGMYNVQKIEAPSVDLQAIEQETQEEAYSENREVRVKSIELAAPDCYAGFETLTVFQHWYSNLAPLQKILIHMQMSGITQQKIATELKMSQPTVNRRLNELKDSLRRALYA